MKDMGGSLRMPAFAAVATITAALCLGHTFLRGTWFFPSVVAVLFVGAGCEIARRMSTSRATVPLGGLAALAAYLLVRYGHDESLFHVVPTTATLDRLGDLASNGRRDIRQFAAPIGVSPGIEFLTVGGVGLVALAVDTLAVTWRRAALAGLPLLVLYTVPTAVAPEGVNWVAFAIGAIGFLALLLAESRERVSRWGRPMRFIVDRPNLRPSVETSPLGQVGRRVGATALGLALIVPAVLPDVSTSAFGFGSGGFGNGGGGGNRVAVVNPIVDLGRNLRRSVDRPVISYRGQPTYLRLVGLDEFTGNKWQPSELEVSRNDNDIEDGLVSAPGLGGDVKQNKRRYQIQVFDLEQTWLPLPYPTKRVSIEGTWLYDPSTFNVFGENTSTRQLEYDVRSLEVVFTAEKLRQAGTPPRSVSRYLDLPEDLPDEIGVQAEEITKDAQTDYDAALAIQDWLRDPERFTYSTEVSDTVGDANGSDAILAFLETRQGYCVHFASAMAVMARGLGIPARVAVGFTPGVADGQGGHTVGLHDLHSWPELYFEGSGWVRFEPTPSERTGLPPTWARPDVNGAGAGGAPAPSASSDTSGPRRRTRATVRVLRSSMPTTGWWRQRRGRTDLDPGRAPPHRTRGPRPARRARTDPAHRPTAEVEQGQHTAGARSGGVGGPAGHAARLRLHLAGQRPAAARHRSARPGTPALGRGRRGRVPDRRRDRAGALCARDDCGRRRAAGRRGDGAGQPVRRRQPVGALAGPAAPEVDPRRVARALGALRRRPGRPRHGGRLADRTAAPAPRLIPAGLRRGPFPPGTSPTRGAARTAFPRSVRERQRCADGGATIRGLGPVRGSCRLAHDCSSGNAPWFGLDRAAAEPGAQPRSAEPRAAEQ